MFGILKQFFLFADRERKTWARGIAMAFLESLIEAGQIVAMALILKALIDRSMTIEKVLGALGIELIVIIATIFTQRYILCTEIEASYHMCDAKRIAIGERLKYMPMGYFNKNSLGDITATVTLTLEELEKTGPVVVMSNVHGMLYTFVMSLALAIFNWQIGVILFAGCMVYLWFNSVLQKKTAANASRRQQAQSKLVGAVLEYIQGMSVVKAFNLDRDTNQEVNKKIEEVEQANYRVESGYAPYVAIQDFLLRGTCVLVVLAALLMFLNGELELFVAILLVISGFFVYAKLEVAGKTSAQFRYLQASMNRVERIFDTPLMDTEGKEIHPNVLDIELNHVDFSYGDRKIIDDVSLYIPEHTTTAIIGPSGGGKTTLCNLIARFWDVDRGSITLGGINVKEYKLDSLMANISMVFQNVYLFRDTIANNIKFGKPNATREEIIAAAKKACCHDFIMALPQGYDTNLGESGATISGGEKQRISIARAILKDAPIVILDEATANVDPENESQLQKAIEELTRDKTLIMIAHRLKTVRHADQIVVVKDGRIVQKGTHEELTEQKGIYADFIQIRQKAVGWKLSTE